MIAREKVLVVDIDGTLCPVKTADQNYADLPINAELVAQLRQLRGEGWRIILNSARGMQTHDGNAGAITRHVLPTLIAWLERHDIPHDELHIAKPWPGRDGSYIDDRTVRPREFLAHSLEELEAICARDRFHA